MAFADVLSSWGTRLQEFTTTFVTPISSIIDSVTNTYRSVVNAAQTTLPQEITPTAPRQLIDTTAPPPKIIPDKISITPVMAAIFAGLVVLLATR